jgi:hypothetical protein
MAADRHAVAAAADMCKLGQMVADGGCLDCRCDCGGAVSGVLPVPLAEYLVRLCGELFFGFAGVLLSLHGSSMRVGVPVLEWYRVARRICISRASV